MNLPLFGRSVAAEKRAIFDLGRVCGLREPSQRAQFVLASKLDTLRSRMTNLGGSLLPNFWALMFEPNKSVSPGSCLTPPFKLVKITIAYKNKTSSWHFVHDLWKRGILNQLHKPNWLHPNMRHSFQVESPRDSFTSSTTVIFSFHRKLNQSWMNQWENFPTKMTATDLGPILLWVKHGETVNPL